jgi:hypothetical protein
MLPSICSLSNPKISTSNLIPIDFAYLKLESNSKPPLVKVLLDSGASASLIKQARESNLITLPAEHTKWKTSAGTFNTKKQAMIQFILPELHENKTITLSCHIAPTLG